MSNYLTKPIIHTFANIPFYSGPNHVKDYFKRSIESYYRQVGVPDEVWTVPQPHLVLNQANFGKNQDLVLDHLESLKCVLHLQFDQHSFAEANAISDEVDIVFQAYRERILRSLPERLQRSKWLAVFVTGDVNPSIMDDIADLVVCSRVIVEKSNNRGIIEGKVATTTIRQKAIIR